MIGLDTNVLVRYIMQDDPVQSPEATAVIQSLTPAGPGFISIVALVE
jgi:predicted nucleic-acid-binding protein